MANKSKDEAAKTKSVATILESLDSETVAALRDVTKNNPELLRKTLADLGYLQSETEERFVTEDAVELSELHRRIVEALQGMEHPRMAKEVAELFEEDHPELVEDFQSAKYRPWVSTKLNEMVEEGILGRFRDGRAVRYTVGPTDAVRYWALHNNRFVEDLKQSDARTIADDTGMPIRSVRMALEELTSK